MTIDLHIHSSASDGKFTVKEIMLEAKTRNINFLAITDHDNINCQSTAIEQAKATGIRYITGVELNVTFTHPKYREGKAVSLDFLGYQYNQDNEGLQKKLSTIANYRQERAAKILGNLNKEFQKENIPPLTNNDFRQIEESIEGTLGRPHIADYLIKKKIVTSRQEAFDKYLVKCDVPKYPLYLKEASKLIRNAGGLLVFAHGNDPHGTSLVALTKNITEQTEIIQNCILPYIDGLECWHSRLTAETTNQYSTFAKEQCLILTGGSDCHQKPIIMGTVAVPVWVADQFKK